MMRAMVRSRAPGTSAYSGRDRSGAWAAKIRRRARGSLTLEAALTLPLFLFFILAVMSFLMMLHVQMYVQSSMEDASRKMGKAAFLMQQADSVLSGGGGAGAMSGGGGTGGGGGSGAVSGGGGTGGAGAELDQGTRTILQAGISSATIQIELMADGTLRQMLDHSRVQGGSGGIYTHASSYDPASGILDMVAGYDYRIPWLPGALGNIRLVNRARSHTWTGDSLTKGSGSGSEGSQKVYVTPTGTVYHTSPDCHYLDLSIHAVSGGAVGGMRNASGARYYPCEECARGGASGTVYITDYGTSYHTSLSCSGLKRTVQEVEIDEVSGMRMCTKCAQHGPHTH